MKIIGVGILTVLAMVSLGMCLLGLYYHMTRSRPHLPIPPRPKYKAPQPPPFPLPKGWDK